MGIIGPLGTLESDGMQIKCDQLYGFFVPENSVSWIAYHFPVASYVYSVASSSVL